MRNARTSAAPVLMSNTQCRPSFAEALAKVVAAAPQPASECVALSDAFGRITAKAIYARADCPRFDVSAMDGFAVAASDTLVATLHRPVAITLGAPAHAGGPGARLLRGSAIPISTGAPIPAGCDSVIVRERARIVDGLLQVTEPVDVGCNVRQCGEDASAGDVILSQGSVITPVAIGALAAYGVGAVQVRRRPSVALFSTGDELVAAAQTPGAANTFDANGPMINALLIEAGLDPVLYPVAPDDPPSLAALIDEIGLSAPDMIVSTGGVSAGDRDCLRRVLEARGATIHFHGVSMRPGKPVLFATLPNGTMFFGLPGNPLAALVGARFFVLAAVRAMLGLLPETGIIVPTPDSAREGITIVLSANSTRRLDDSLGAEPRANQKSHKLRPALGADSWLVIDEAGIARLFPIRIRAFEDSVPL